MYYITSMILNILKMFIWYENSIKLFLKACKMKYKTRYVYRTFNMCYKATSYP